jgi:proteic killer suppression protein
MLRKLAQVDAAERLDDLRGPPGNRLEALNGDRRGRHSIRAEVAWLLAYIDQQVRAHPAAPRPPEVSAFLARHRPPAT